VISLFLLALVAADADTPMRLTCHGSTENNLQVDVEIDGPKSRIRVPDALVPYFHGGDHGWFKFKNIKIEPTRITGSAAVGIGSHPKVYIDRQTGSITISGWSGDWAGTCERAPEPSQATRF